MARGGTKVPSVSRSACACDVAEVEVLGRGAIAKPIKIGEVRELEQAELSRLNEKRTWGVVQKFRDSHRKLAWLFASGMTTAQAVEASGYSYSRVTTLHQTPAFQQLIAELRERIDEHRAEVVDDFEELIRKNMLKAERQISDHLDKADEEEELLPIRSLIAIGRDAADRLGYGKKTTQVNVNVDFAAKLDRARARSTKVIESSANLPTPTTLKIGEAKAPPSTSSVPLLKAPPLAAASPGVGPLLIKRRVA